MGIYSKIQDYVGQQKSNVFDLSFVNNLTLPVGALVPCCVKEVVNGDKFRIRGRFGFNFLPTYFPIQSTLKVDCQFFYVRNRNLWNRWEDFQFNPDISSDPDLTPPFYPTAALQDSLAPGTLADYMGLPTVVPSSFYESYSIGGTLSTYKAKHFYFKSTPASSDKPNFILLDNMTASESDSYDKDSWGVLLSYSAWANNNAVFMPTITSYARKFKLVLTPKSGTSSSTLSSYKIYYYKDGILNTYLFSTHLSLTKPVEIIADSVLIPSTLGSTSIPASTPFASLALISDGTTTSESNVALPFTYKIYPLEVSSDIPAFNLVNPLTNSSTGSRISALPFRAYESIYNAFYRDERVNPLLDSSNKPVYNKWLLDTSGGPIQALNFPTLHYRNWELDPYTSAQTSPQQGIAPLVGVTSVGDMKFASSDGQTYTIRPNLADDGTTVVNAELSSDIPSDVRRSFINLATSGISINDFRNVNSFQRWLETNMRRGFKYRDQIIAHTGVRPRFDVLDMPEFIGGFSTIVNSQKVNQTSESTPDNPLGSYAGQMSAFGNSSHDINVTCDENGFIIGIVCVYPVPVYSTLLPPFYSYSQPLDYYNQEFSHIGMQPIYNYMVAPNLAVGDSLAAVWSQNSKVFGYQRAWWQYLSSTDEVHGEFLTSFKDFLFRRDFGNQPTLSPDFTVIDPDKITNPFSVRDSKDKVLGQIAFDIKAIRPIPKFGIPRIE